MVSRRFKHDHEGLNMKRGRSAELSRETKLNLSFGEKKRRPMLLTTVSQSKILGASIDVIAELYDRRFISRIRPMRA